MVFLVTIFALVFLALVSARAQESLPNLEIDSLTDATTIVHNFENETLIGSNGVMIKQGSSILLANDVFVDETTRQVIAKGALTWQSDNLYWTGEHLEYNFITREIGATSFRAGTGGIFMEAEQLSGSTTNRSFQASNARFTTDDRDKPGYYIRAKSVTIEQGKRVTAREATLYIGKVPVFYLPYYSRN